MRNFSITTDIGAAPERVWQVMSDVERWSEWTASVTSVKRQGGARGPLAVGERAVVRQPKFPPALWKVTDVQPGRSFTWVSTAPGFRAVSRHSVEPTPTGSRATLSLELEGLLGGVWGSLTKGITQRYVGMEARGLKARSEDPAFRHAVRTGTAA